MNGLSQSSASAVSQLCRACGLCCNGVLFADVELQPGDDPEQLVKLGLAVSRRKRTPRLLQPCACFEGNRCRIYEDRPVHCRAFECRLLQQVQTNATTVELALKVIASAHEKAEAVRKLLRRLGQGDEELALSHRYAQVMAEPLDLSEDNASEVRGELMMAMHRLMQLLHRQFLV